MHEVVRAAELRVPSDLTYLRPVRVFVRELAQSTGFPHEKAHDMELAVDEIFSNAIEHGSPGSESQIMIRCQSNEEMMKIIVSDSGRGERSNAQWIRAWSDAVREKTQSGTERGHGLLLAHNLTDEMSMESNPIGGVDVHLVMYKGEQRIAQR